MLYFTIIGIVCVAVAPVGTLALGIKDRFSSKIYFRDADQGHAERRSVQDANLPGNSGKALVDRGYLSGPGLEIENVQKVKQDNADKEVGGFRDGKRKLLTSDSFELDLSGDLVESENAGGVRTGTLAPVTAKIWKRKRSAKTNLNDVAADAEIDMNKRIERLARECSLHGEVEDTLKSPLTEGTTPSPQTDGLQEVLEIFSGTRRERGALPGRRIREAGSGRVFRSRFPRRRHRRRRKRKMTVVEGGAKSSATNGYDQATQVPMHVRGRPLGFLRRRKTSFRGSLLPNLFRHKPAIDEQPRFDFDQAVTGAPIIYTSPPPSEECNSRKECTPFIGVFERKMKEFHDQQKMRSMNCSTECSTTGGCSEKDENKFKDFIVPSSTPPCELGTTVSDADPHNYELLSNGSLSPDRYLKIRHALRNYLIKANVLSPKFRNWHRKRRCNKQCCPMRKCKKAPPMICLPFVKKGQDDMLKFLINVMQSMLDKSCNSKKPYSLDKLKYKASNAKTEDSWESVETEILSCDPNSGQPCQKTATQVPCPAPFAIFPFPMPYPSCNYPSTYMPVTYPPAYPSAVPMTYPPPTYPSTCPPPCPSTCPTPTTTTHLPPSPPPTPPPTITCSEPTKGTSRPCISFDPITAPAVIIPTFFPPWPTTKVESITDPCPHTVATDRNIGGSCCLETLPPWPTPPPYMKSTTCKTLAKSGRFLEDKYQLPLFDVGEPIQTEKAADYIEDPSQTMVSKNRIINPYGTKVNRLDFETMYDFPGQESVEEAEIDVRSHLFDDDPDNTGDPLRAVYDGYFEMAMPSVDQTKIMDKRVYDYNRRKYPRRRMSKRMRKIKEDPERQYNPCGIEFPSSREKRDELLSDESTEVFDPSASIKSSSVSSTTEKSTSDSTVTSSKATTDASSLNKEISNHRNQYESYVQERNDEKKPTTLKSAAIVRGPKRLSNHPQAKVFAKVYPESYSYISVDSTTAKVEKTTTASQNANSSLMHLQLLAVCEGYLEMIKLLKIQNQTNGDLDAELIRYCENELSRNYDSPRDGSKLKKSVETTTSTQPEIQTKNMRNQLESSISRRDLRNKIVVDILGSPIYKEMRSQLLMKNSNRYGGRESLGEMREKRRRRRRKRREKKRGYRNFQSRERKDVTTDNVDSVGLLRKKKGSLASWLLNKKETEVTDTEYVDDADGKSDENSSSEQTESTSGSSSTHSARRKETSTETSSSSETVYPIYAKKYGYDNGGELGEIEILWRTLNEKNETKDIVKNMTVLAMLMNPEEEERDVKLVEESGELKSDTANFGGKSRGKQEASNSNSQKKKANGTLAVLEEDEVNEMIEEDETTPGDVTTSEAATTTGHVTTTEHYITTTHKNRTINGTYASAVSTAKELVKDYTIEFLNYAVYIIPIMFILLFLVCCVCFILKIMIHNRKRRKKNKNKRKKMLPPSSETDSETSESSVLTGKNKKGGKPKKMESLKHRSKKLWAAFKSRKKEESEEEDDTEEEKNRWREKKFLHFLRKEKRNKGKDDADAVDSSEDFMRKLKRKKERDLDAEDSDGNERKPVKMSKKRRKKSMDFPEEDDDEDRTPLSEKKGASYKSSCNSVDGKCEDTRIQKHRDAAAKERRELIALLEELKNMEEDTKSDKKEYKSVFVQYMTQEEDKIGDGINFSANAEGDTVGKKYSMEPTFGDQLQMGDVNSHFDRSRSSDIYRNRGSCFPFDRRMLIASNANGKITEDVFGNFRRVSRDLSAELSKGNAKDIAYKFEMLLRMLDRLPRGDFSPRKKSILEEELENLKRRISCRKYVILKDDGVLCRL